MPNEGETILTSIFVAWKCIRGCLKQNYKKKKNIRKALEENGMNVNSLLPVGEIFDKLMFIFFQDWLLQLIFNGFVT